MKRSALLLLCSFLLFMYCSKKSAPVFQNPELLFKSLASASDFDSALACYSSGTKKAVKSIISSGRAEKDDLLQPLLFLKGVKTWNIADRSISENSADVELVILGHSVDNMVGCSIRCRLVRENGGWLIDMKKGIESMENSLKNNAGREYLSERYSKYQ